MSLTFKLLSLAIRTAAKPIGNYIKKQAKEHEGFRRFAVAQAQRVHRIDMRMRLGILHDPAAQERMHDREVKAAEDKKRREETPTVRTETEQKKHDEEKAKEEKEAKEGKKKEEKAPKIKIRPLSETRAIELGANFFSEAFIFAVAAGLVIWDSWRSRRKASARRDVVAERLQQLEDEVKMLQSQLPADQQAAMIALGQSLGNAEEKETASWWNPMSWIPQKDTHPANPSEDDGSKKSVSLPVGASTPSHEQTPAASIDSAKAQTENNTKDRETEEKVQTVVASSSGR